MSVDMSLSLEEALASANQALEDGEFVDALGFVKQALALAPQDADALELKGLALAELGEFEEADDAFAALLKVDPKHVTGLIAAADLKIREPGDDRERIEEGLALLRRAEAAAKQAATGKARTAAEMEREERAQEAAAIELELLRGIAMNQLGDLEAALAAFGRVLALDPDHSEAQLERALGVFEQGRF